MAKIKIKAKLKRDNVSVKVLAKSPMAGKEEAANRKIPIEYITHMRATFNDELVWEASTGPFLSKNPYMQFVFNATEAGAKKGDKIEISLIDSNGKTSQKSQKIK